MDEASGKALIRRPLKKKSEPTPKEECCSQKCRHLIWEKEGGERRAQKNVKEFIGKGGSAAAWVKGGGPVRKSCRVGGGPLKRERSLAATGASREKDANSSRNLRNREEKVLKCRNRWRDRRLKGEKRAKTFSSCGNANKKRSPELPSFTVPAGTEKKSQAKEGLGGRWKKSRLEAFLGGGGEQVPAGHNNE